MRARLAASIVSVGLILAAVGTQGGLAAPPRRVPPPTPVPPFGSPSPFPTALETPASPAREPDPSAAAAVLFDLDTGQVLYERKPSSRRAIASTTKIMTALLVLETTEPKDRVTASATAASQTGALLGLVEGERVRVEDLLYALMLQSANDAAVALAEHVSGSVGAFVQQMNRRARRLGLEDTRFASPNGLDDSGYSTAADLAAITVRAYRQRGFTRIVRTKFHTVPAPEGPDRRIQNRNALLWLYPKAIGVKTGYTFAARFCLVAAAERGGTRLGTVVLGAPADAFSDAAALLDFGFDRFESQVIVARGEEVDAVEVDGEPVPTEAARKVELLLERGTEPEIAVRPLGDAALPVAEGQRIGVVVVRTAASVERVPAIATAAVTPPPPPPAPSEPASWWEGAVEGIVGSVRTFLRAVFG